MPGSVSAFESPYTSTTPGRAAALLALAIATGAVTAYAALLFVQLIVWLQALIFDVESLRVHDAVARLPGWYVVVVTTVGGLCVGLLARWLLPGGRHLGPDHAMQAVREHDGMMSLRETLGNSALAVISIGSGASLGRYGPAVHLGAGIASRIAQWVELPRAQRLTLLGSGVAAAIAATFNAPLAGIVFANEVMLDTFARRGFVAIAIAAVTGTAIARLHGADFHLAYLTGPDSAELFEFLLLAATGSLGGVVAVLFIRGMDWCSTSAARLPVLAPLRAAVAGCLLGVLALEFPHVIGLGDDTIQDTLAGSLPLTLLFSLVLVKLVASLLCIAGGFGGGVFGPALFLGAVLGGGVGQALQLIDPALVSSPATYAVAGMGAVISVVIGAPLTTVLIVFELTSSYALTTAVLVAVVAANLTARRLCPYSWFNLQLMRRGVDLRTGREVRIMRSRTVRELLSDDCMRIEPSLSLDQAKLAMLDLQTEEALVVDASNQLLGRLSLVQVLGADLTDDRPRSSGEAAVTVPIVLEASMNLDAAMHRLRDFVGRSVPVVESHETMRLAGVIFPASVISAYNEAVAQARREERGAV